MMKRAIYMAFTLVTALSMGGCSSALTTKDMTILEEAEGQSTKAASNTESFVQSSEAKQKEEDAKEAAADTVFNQQKQNESTTTTGRISKATEESEMKISLEGMTETLPTRLYSSDLGYQMQIDEQRFTYERKDGADFYQVTNPDSNQYPDIYIKISTENKSDQNYFELMEEKLLTVNPKAEKLDPVRLGNNDAVHFHTVYGEDYNSKIENIYVIEGEDSYFTIEVQYFLEAEEGYGARIAALLDTFTLTR